jgi:intergrase/recombinase
LLDFIVYSLFIVLFISSLTAIVLLIIKNKKLEVTATQLALEKYSISVKLQKLAAEKDSKQLEQTEGFMRFISESRDQAFKYIEDVQDAIQALDSFKRGTKEFNEAYKVLISFLPEKNIKND